MNRNRLVLICALTSVGCLADDEFIEEDQLRDHPEADPTRADPTQADPTTNFDELELHWTGDGRIAGLSFRDHRPIFEYEGDPLPALQRWVGVHARELGLSRQDATADALELELERELEPRPGLVIHRYVQRYRGYPISGPEAIVSLTSIDGAVISITGAFMDARVELAGLDRALDSEAAARRVLAHAEPDAELLELELVAVPARETMAWVAEVEAEVGSDRITIAAATGELLSKRSTAVESSFDDMPISVIAHEFDADPDTTDTALYGAMGSTWNVGWTPTYGWFLRMGNDRVLPFSFEFDNDALPYIDLTPQFNPSPTPYATFLATPASDADEFRTQNVFHKVSAGLGVLDGHQSAFGWDHPAGSPWGTFTPGPLNVLTNLDKFPDYDECNVDADCLSNDCDEGYCRCTSSSDCDGGLRCLDPLPGTVGGGKVCRESDLCLSGQAAGLFSSCNFNGAGLQLPYPGEETSCLYSCNGDTQTDFHELGHYLDRHAAHEIMGDEVDNGTCNLGTTDEAIPLRETIADMTGLYLIKELYPVDYTASATDDPCRFLSLMDGAWAIHHQDCINIDAEVGWWPDDQTDITPGLGGNCHYGDGYRIHSIYQAVWAWLNSKTCSRTSPYSCYTMFLPNTEDLFIDGMIYALSLSNAQSYEQFFENIETYIWATEGSYESDWFRTIMARYGILDP